MKRLIAGLLFVTGGSSLALPLSAVIAQEGARLTKKTVEWKRKCGTAEDGNKLWYDCQPKLVELSGEWGKFVVMINEELKGIGKPAANEDKLITDRRRLMQFELRYAVHNITCLGVDTAECSDEEARLTDEGKACSNDLAWWAGLRQLDSHGKSIPLKGVDN